LNIVHVSVGSLPPVFERFGGAIQRRVGELAKAQARLGHQVTVFSPAAQSYGAEIDGVRVSYLRCRAPGTAAHLEYQARAAASLARSRARPDVIHFHSEPEGALATSLTKAARVLSYDNYLFRGGPVTPLVTIYRRLLERFDALLPCSEYCKAQSSRYWSISPNRMQVVYNGVNLSQFKPDPEAARREQDRLGLHEKFVMYLGRVCEQKGTDTLLRAYEGLRRSHPDVGLVIAGPANNFDRSGKDAAAGEWEGRIDAVGGTYLGTVADERLAGLLSAAEVFVMPTTELEMFGMAAIEAQACGTAVIASDHGGLREIVPPGTGLRFPPGDSEALHGCLIRLLDDAGLRADYSAGALNHAAAFGWDTIASGLDPIYADAISRSASI
jgi:glycosyltransferase involved in cell wall biosynthesis